MQPIYQFNRRYKTDITSYFLPILCKHSEFVNRQWFKKTEETHFNQH